MAETLEMEVETLNGPDNNERESKIDLPKATASSDSSSSDSDSDEDNSDLKLGTLEKEIAENPSSYDIHVQVRSDLYSPVAIHCPILRIFCVV